MPPVPQHLDAAFADWFGRRPSRVCTAPGRVNLIGEHLDYNGGRCLPIALRYSCAAACAPREDGIVRVRSEQTRGEWAGSVEEAGSAPGWAGYAAGVVWALAEAGHAMTGLDVLLDGDVPLGAGLSSSAAVECAVGLAVAGVLGLRDDEQTRRQLVQACVRAENDVVGAPTGGMDQTVALLAEVEHALLIDFASDRTQRVRWQPERLGARLLVVDTGVQHALGDGSYGDRREECAEAARLLGIGALAAADEDAVRSLEDDLLRRRARHVVSEQARVAQVVASLERDDLVTVGKLFTSSHESLRDDFEVSCPELDAVVDCALAQGALGARMTGGGFGGSAVALVPAERADAVREAVTDVFAGAGWSSPAFLDGTAGPGARTLRG